jgi:hypothetical protein
MSVSSLAAKANDLKVSWVLWENLTLNVQGVMVFPDGSWVLPPSWYTFVDVVSSDICDEDREKHDYARSISRMKTVRFRLVHTLSKGNSLTPSIAVLCCRKIICLGWVTGCYLYRLENHLIDMPSFQFCYNLNKCVPDWDSWLGLRPVSQVVVAIGPSAWLNISGTVSNIFRYWENISCIIVVGIQTRYSLRFVSHNTILK